MPTRRARLHGAILAVLLLGGASGCSSSVSIGRSPTSSSTQGPDRPASAQAVSATGRAQRPGTCRIAPPQVHVPTGQWTATETILSTDSIDACAGERLVRPWDFRRVCNAGNCKTYLYTVSYYGVDTAEVVPDGRGRYVATFQTTAVPCPHRPGENAGTNEDHGAFTLWWSPDKQTLHGLSRDYQVGSCSGGSAETSSYVATRTFPAASPPAEGP
jgi:hypothetical protein